MTPTTTPPYRYALVRGAAFKEQVERLLPDNYWIVNEVHDDNGTDRLVPAFVIEGEDKAGWTLDDYVIPRLGTGLCPAVEITVEHEAIPPFVKNPDRIRRDHPLAEAARRLNDEGLLVEEAIKAVGLDLTPEQYVYFCTQRAARGIEIFPELDPRLRTVAPSSLQVALTAAYMDGLAIGYEAASIAHRAAWKRASSTP